ncbi:MAG: hypothetical protein QG573_2808 [Acidobacteriota bacterium]|nr:hypothetical protein [Acidobacteriota bacterium]
MPKKDGNRPANLASPIAPLGSRIACGGPCLAGKVPERCRKGARRFASSIIGRLSRSADRLSGNRLAPRQLGRPHGELGNRPGNREIGWHLVRKSAGTSSGHLVSTSSGGWHLVSRKSAGTSSAAPRQRLVSTSSAGRKTSPGDERGAPRLLRNWLLVTSVYGAEVDQRSASPVSKPSAKRFPFSRTVPFCHCPSGFVTRVA